MDNIKLYTVSEKYVRYLSDFAPHLFYNQKTGHQRAYIGIVLFINGLNYFAPLSSFKEKHKRMQESLDFIKVKRYAVININNMFPVNQGDYEYIDISKEKDKKYRTLLLAEYRYIKSIQEKIRKSAVTIYKLKTSGVKSPLTKRCNDFLLLEQKCFQYKEK